MSLVPYLPQTIDLTSSTYIDKYRVPFSIEALPLVNGGNAPIQQLVAQDGSQATKGPPPFGVQDRHRATKSTKHRI